MRIGRRLVYISAASARKIEKHRYLGLYYTRIFPCCTRSLGGILKGIVAMYKRTVAAARVMWECIWSPAAPQLVRAVLRSVGAHRVYEYRPGRKAFLCGVPFLTEPEHRNGICHRPRLNSECSIYMIMCVDVAQMAQRPL